MDTIVRISISVRVSNEDIITEAAKQKIPMGDFSELTKEKIAEEIVMSKFKKVDNYTYTLRYYRK